jgi:hypothetical protein
MEQGAVEMAYTFDSDIVSDLHKDAYGFRPSSTWWAQWRAMTDADRQEEWDRMCREVEDSEARRFQAEAAAQQRWERHIDQLMVTNGIDRATAIRWDMEAEDAGGDVGFYCFLAGIGYHNEADILGLIGEKVSAA